MNHGFYSAKMAKAFPDTVVYWRSVTGEKLTLTAVGSPPSGGLKWDDVEDLGPVLDFLGRMLPVSPKLWLY